MGIVLKVDTDEQTRSQVLSVLGEVDIATVEELEEKIASLAATGYSLVMDLTSTDFMDSSGLRLLVATQDQMTGAGQRFKVAVGGGPIARLLDVTGLLSHLEIHDSVEEAISG